MADDTEESAETEEVSANSDMGSVGNVDEQTANVAGLDMLALSHASRAGGGSDLLNRYMVARNAGMAFGGDRDYYEVLGYDRDPDAEEYLTKYLRNDIARRIVDAPVEAAWREPPNIVDDADAGSDEEAETDFEEAVEYLFEGHRLLHYLKRADKVTGIGEYGLLFLGLAPEGSDGGRSGPDALDDDATAGSYTSVLDTRNDDRPDALAYLSTFSQARVTSIHEVSDPTNPRYGMPELYEIKFTNPGGVGRSEDVHHSRVIHIAEGLLENEVFGRPRLEPVLNRLEDLEKVLGGSAEMFWRGADRKLQLDYRGEGAPNDSDELEQRAREMNHGIENVLPTTNVDINEIGGQEVDPTGIVEQELKHIAGTVGIPLRMLTGSERGELASTQDRATFYERIRERQEQFCEPMILRPLLDRLIRLGILPEPRGGSYTVEWPDLFSLNELEQAELQAQQAQAIKRAAPMGDPAQLATVPEIRENVFGWSPERGSEVSDTSGRAAPPEESAPEDDGPPEEETDEEREAFEEVMGEGQAAWAEEELAALGSGE